MESLPWARHFAKACTAKLPSHLDLNDLQSAGVLGYLKAAPRYNPALGASFRGYCAVRIRGAVLDELRRWDWAPRSVYQQQKRITRITSELTEQLKREPTRKELAEVLEIEEAELTVYENQAQVRQMVSLHENPEYGCGDEGLSLSERLPDPLAVRPDAAVLSAEDRCTIRRCLESLPAKQAQVITLHYLRNVPLREVARKLVVTPSRISQLHHQALGRLKHAWEKSSSGK